jgi:hypothetical protein
MRSSKRGQTGLATVLLCMEARMTEIGLNWRFGISGMLRDGLRRLITRIVVSALLAAASPAAATQTALMERRGQIVLMLHAGVPWAASQLLLRMLR